MRAMRSPRGHCSGLATAAARRGRPRQVRKEVPVIQRRCLLASGLAALLIAAAGLAAAQDRYPARPITFVYGYAAGSSSDAAWRAVVQEAARRIGQPIVFDNRPGANGR